MAESAGDHSETGDYRLISKADAEAFATRLLVANGTPTSHAEHVAACLVLADLRGIESHGINRLIPYLIRVRAGLLDPAAEPILKQVTPVVGEIDGKNGWGFLTAKAGMQRACDMAQTFGIGMVSAHHSNHFGMSAWIVEQAIEAGMMSLVFTNSSSALPAFGGREKLLGVSPIAAGAPGGNHPPFILDFAPSVAARGKVHKALRRGEEIPFGWALDAEGRDTTDPAAALEGTMLPMAGPKGSALAIMMDVFSGVLSGSAFAGEVVGPYDKTRGPGEGVGHLFVAMKPDLFVSGEEFRHRMNHLYERVTGSKKADGVERIYFPGEVEGEKRKQREVSGIPFAHIEVNSLNEEARKAGVEGI
ncbi:malate/L-lactate dehydrogenase-like protein [Eremomyces bilateralis CBS 781.70]|uniref:Malate/L-lactate dehydrogenase-like protein n=1 Tax=Eremomyces bilateralis CBS 781.70 TaxID=1392243 RepID=A0A6G1FSL7_9PEZI|nr:malate/L-lactate dehydrogenase-like protein [Eremomyces bilateralis CBS 781.70]KAF1808672.1 malate/L-lactate dehydrogenase-like protein [Eremomyces bilateralis CBS 781.70]